MLLNRSSKLFDWIVIGVPKGKNFILQSSEEDFQYRLWAYG